MLFSLRALSGTISMRRANFGVGFLTLVMAVCIVRPATGQISPGRQPGPWFEGSENCTAQPGPKLQVQAYNSDTLVLREGLCATAEAPFMYLLIGRARALLIDTGDLADPAAAPLAATVESLLPRIGGAPLPLLVAHTHRHQDHRAGDVQFDGIPNVTVAGYDLPSVQHFFRFTDWPDRTSKIDLGGRTIDLVPTPGHNPTELTFYDRKTGLLFTGDLLMPGRLLIENITADRASAARLVAFTKNRPVSAVFGGHVEFDRSGRPFGWQSQHHPDEHRLALDRSAVMALSAALARFNGFYTESGGFVMLDSFRLLLVAAIATVLMLLGATTVCWRWRRRAHQTLLKAPPPSRPRRTRTNNSS